MIPAEAEPCAQNSDESAGDDIEAMVVKLEEAGGGNVEGYGDWDERKSEEVGRWCGGLVADWYDSPGVVLEVLCGATNR